MRQRTKRLGIVGIIVALLVLVCCAATACGSFNKSPSNPTKTVKSITVIVSNQSYDYDETRKSITVTEGETFDLQKSDLTVTVNYSDDTTATLKESDFTVDTSTLPATLTAEETYTVSITYGSLSETIFIYVVAETKESVTVYRDGISVRYDGTEKSLIAEYDKAHGSKKLSKLIADGKVSAEPATVEETDAGTYLMTITPQKGYQLNDGTDESLQISFTIQPALIRMPTVIGESSFEYDGTEKTLNLNLYGQDDVLTFVNGGNDTRKARTVGSYTCRMMIRTEKQNNYTFDEGGNTPVGNAVDVATFTITPKILSVPVVVGKEKDEDGFYHFSYTGEQVLPTLSVNGTELSAARDPETNNYKYDYGDDAVILTLGSSDYENVNALSGDSYFTTKGFYYRRISCILGDPDNYRWATEEDPSVCYVVDQAVSSLPDDIGDHLKFLYPYNGEAITLGDDGGRAQVNCYVNDYYTLITEGTLETTRPLMVDRLMLSPASATYLTNNNVPFVITPYNEDTSWYVEGTNYEFTFKQAYELKEAGSNIAEVGKTYAITVVYRKGLSDSNGWENYEPLEIEAEVEIIKGAVNIYEINSTKILRSDNASVLMYGLYKDGSPMLFYVDTNLSLSVLDVTHTFRRTENDEYEETSDLTQAGFYRSKFTLDFDKDLYVGIRQAENVYTAFVDPIDSYVYDWSIAKRNFCVNGTDNPIEFYLNIKTGEVTYSAGAHYTEYFPEDSGMNYNINVPVQEIFTVSYKATEDGAYEVLVPVNGKYDFSRDGYYKLHVDLTYDENNFTTLPISDNAWHLEREEIVLDPASCFDQNNVRFQFNDGFVSATGDVVIEYKATEEGEYEVLDPSGYNLSNAGYYRASQNIDYDVYHYYYEVNGEPSYRVVYEWTQD